MVSQPDMLLSKYEIGPQITPNLGDGLRIFPSNISKPLVTPWKTNMEPKNPWLVEENRLPWDQEGPGRQGLCLC